MMQWYLHANCLLNLLASLSQLLISKALEGGLGNDLNGASNAKMDIQLEFW
jgi:hypothetical protein